jgi:hypothetical protein
MLFSFSQWCATFEACSLPLECRCIAFAQRIGHTRLRGHLLQRAHNTRWVEQHQLQAGCNITCIQIQIRAQERNGHKKNALQSSRLVATTLAAVLFRPVTASFAPSAWGNPQRALTDSQLEGAAPSSLFPLALP